jgi:hypothetical protein
MRRAEEFVDRYRQRAGSALARCCDFNGHSWPFPAQPVPGPAATTATSCNRLNFTAQDHQRVSL